MIGSRCVKWLSSWQSLSIVDERLGMFIGNISQDEARKRADLASPCPNLPLKDITGQESRIVGTILVAYEDIAMFIEQSF
jgi:hypothetical protein